MELMLAVMILLGAAVIGAWRLESEFDRESHLQPESLQRTDYLSGDNR